jgi:ribosome recycling factor
MARRKPIRQINLRISEELRRQLESAAEEQRVSANELMRQLLEDGLKKKKAKQSLEDRVRNLEDRVQRMGSQTVLLDEAERQRREQEEGGSK